MSSRLKPHDQVTNTTRIGSMHYLALTSTRLLIRPLEIANCTLAFLRTKWSDPFVKTEFAFGVKFPESTGE